MIANVPKLVLAAFLVTLAPAAASAGDRVHGCEDPARVAARAPARPAPYVWRDAAWRDRELRQLRADLRALERDHAAFHARHARHPGKLRKYDRSYLARRAELERRLVALRAVAWR